MASELVTADSNIILDRYTMADVAAQVAGEDDEHARRFGWFPQRSTPQTVARAIADWQRDWQENTSRRTLAIRDASSRQLLGGCEVRLAEDSSAELSYWVFPAHRRRGIGTRAMILLMAWAHAALGIERFELWIEPDNIASVGVARRAGFVATGTTRNEGGRTLEAWERIHGSSSSAG